MRVHPLFSYKNKLVCFVFCPIFRIFDFRQTYVALGNAKEK